MYKTIWAVKNVINNTEIKFTYYHFGKNPQFPKWYMEENHVYEIEMLWNFPLLKTPSLFIKCLTGCYIMK